MSDSCSLWSEFLITFSLPFRLSSTGQPREAIDEETTEAAIPSDRVHRRVITHRKLTEDEAAEARRLRELVEKDKD